MAAPTSTHNRRAVNEGRNGHGHRRIAHQQGNDLARVLLTMALMELLECSFWKLRFGLAIQPRTRLGCFSWSRKLAKRVQVYAVQNNGIGICDEQEQGTTDS